MIPCVCLFFQINAVSGQSVQYIGRHFTLHRLSRKKSLDFLQHMHPDPALSVIDQTCQMRR